MLVCYLLNCRRWRKLPEVEMEVEEHVFFIKQSHVPFGHFHVGTFGNLEFYGGVGREYGGGERIGLIYDLNRGHV